MVTSGAKFYIKTLTKLVNSPNTCVYLKKRKRHIALSPNALNDTKSAIREHLNQLITKFDSELGGVVLGFRNINVLTSFGSILDDSPDIHFDIKAEFYIFKPEKGDVLSGVVKKKSRDNIGCLVHEIFNASIPIDVDDEVNGVDIDNIYIGEPLIFTVEEVNFTESLPYIRGKLVNPEEELQVPQVDFVSDKKRKRSDDQHKHKKLRTEADSSIPVDGINVSKRKQLNEVESFSIVDAESMTNNPGSVKSAFNLKLPTSILKKSTSAGVESSPARRISFYGDAPKPLIKENESLRDFEEYEILNRNNSSECENYDIEGGSNKPKKKKKKNALENESLNNKVSYESENYSVEESSAKPKKKKKKNALVNDSLVNEEVCEETELSNKSVSVKKKKKGSELENVNRETSVRKNRESEIQIHQVHSKKKKKSGGEHESVGFKFEENSKETKQLGKSVQGRPKAKKNKKENEQSVFDTETANVVDNIDLHLEADVTQSKKRKKLTSEVQNDDHVVEKDHHIVEYLGLVPKIKEKVIQSEFQEQEFHTVQHENIHDQTKKKKTKKGKNSIREMTGGDKKVRTEGNSLLPDHEFTMLNSLIPNERVMNISPNNDAHIVSSTDDKKKKKKKMQQENVMSPSGKKDGALPTASKKKPTANSTIIGNTTPYGKKSKHSSESDNSFASLSPIKKLDDHVMKSDEDIGFITSTQVGTYPVVDDVLKSKRKKTMKASKKKLHSPTPDSNLNNLKIDSGNLRDRVVSKSHKSNISKKKSTTSNKPLQGGNQCYLYGTVYDSDSSSSISSDFALSDLDSLLKDKQSSINISNKTNKRKQDKTLMLKPAGSDSSSSDTDVPSPKLTSIRPKEEKQPKKNISQAFDPKTIDAGESSSDTESSLPKAAGNNLQSNVILGNIIASTNSPLQSDSRNESIGSGSDSDSDLPSDRNIRKKLVHALHPRKKFEKQPNISASMKFLPTSNSNLPTEKQEVGSMERNNTLAIEKENREENDSDDINTNLPVAKAYNDKKLQIVGGSESLKKNVLSKLKPGGSQSSSSDSELPPTPHDTVKQKKHKKKTAHKPKHSVDVLSPEKKGSENNNVLVKALLQKVKSEILESPVSSSGKLDKKPTEAISKKEPKLKSLDIEGVTKEKKSSKHKDVTGPLQEKKQADKKAESKKQKTLQTPKAIASFAERILQNLQ